MIKMNKEQEYQMMKEYYLQKYGSSYLSAIAKLNAPFSEAYDGKGYLKPEYALTELEKEALHFHIPEFQNHLDEDIKRR